MKINDLIFRELLKRGYVLEEDTRVWNVADSKLWYLTPKQAQGYLDLSNTKAYKKSIIDKEVFLIKKHMRDFIKIFPKKDYNILDLGCGDGKKASLFIKELAKHMKVRYCPIDISSYMVSKAAKTIRGINVGEVLDFKWNISDFENLDNITPLFRDKEFGNHFMMLLGNTLGNFDREDILNGIKESMNNCDILIIGNGLTNGQEDWATEYKDELIDNWLFQIVGQLGLLRDEISYNVRFTNSRVEEIYILKRDKEVEHLGRTIIFKKGDIITAAISYKYTKGEFKKILEKFFSSVKVYTDNKDTYALAVCKK